MKPISENESKYNGLGFLGLTSWLMFTLKKKMFYVDFGFSLNINNPTQGDIYYTTSFFECTMRVLRDFSIFSKC